MPRHDRSRSKERSKIKKRSRHRDKTPSSESRLSQQLDVIVSRLHALESKSQPSSTSVQPLPVPGTPVGTPSASPTRALRMHQCEGNVHHHRVSTPVPSTSHVCSLSGITEDQSSTERIVDAIRSIGSTVRSKQSYFISSFDPALNDIDVWCSEVDRAKIINNWSDDECLARIGHCLKGDARLWLSEWVSNDRTWTNFKTEFKPLCPKNPDIANILYDVMQTNSDNYPTYADYARRSLLRLRIVRGLSEELISAIIIRGITDPQLRAAATNAKLLPSDLVGFFSIYVKPGVPKSRVTYPISNTSTHLNKNKSTFDNNSRKRRYNEGKCFSCGLPGHKRESCRKKPRIDNAVDSRTSSAASASPKLDSCSFCKKPGHKIDTCFAKLRSESRNRDNVNFCTQSKNHLGSDVVVAIMQGIPVDVLIDSGSTISLISTSLLKYFNCVRKPAFRILKGLGSQEIESSCYVTLPIEFDDLTLEVDFHVVSSEFMNTPIIIGTDVLNRKGVTYVRTCDRQYLKRESVDADRVAAISFEEGDINTPLTGDNLKRLHEIINEFQEFFITGTATSTVTTGSMKIDLTNQTPVCYRPYRLSYSETLRVRDIIKDLLEKGIIRESNSDFASPILLVKKKDGSDRMCVDFRKLNEITVKDRFPLPRIDDHLDRLGHSRFFTSLDMATGFHQIPLQEDAIPKTGFVTPEGHYEYVKMPYGLANAPVVYQKIISNTLRSFIESGEILVYIDDILILSNTVEEGLSRLRKVLKTLTEAGFSINLRKCSFLSTKIEYLGRTISEGQVQPSKEKVRALVEAPIPKNVKQARQFLGLASYFRRYVPGFASLAAPIANLTKKAVAFVWGDDQDRARRNIIEHLISEPALATYDPKLPIEIHTDASSLGYGAVMFQVHESGHKRAVAYYSRLTQGAEPRYHSYELETLAVVKALQHFRHYLVGVHFTVVTDCNALKLTQKKKDLLPRVARWWIYLQDFDFSLEYRKGTSMSHADYLSRNPVNVVHVHRPQNWAQLAQSGDEETQSLLQKLCDGQLDPNRYIKKNDLLYYKYTPTGESVRLLCYIPKGHRLSLLRLFHDEHDHIGVDKTTDLVLKHFWFPNLRAFVRKYISHCLICMSNKRIQRAPLQPIHSWQKPETPFEVIHMDALGPLPTSNGYRFVLIVVDAFSKYTLLYPMIRQDTVELKLNVSNTVSLFGTPKLIVADRGRMFQSSDFLDWVSSLGSEIHLITPEMHQSNGQVERYCRTLLNMIRIESNHRQQEWSSVIWKLQLVLNMTKHKTTQFSPLQLLVGIDTTTPVIRNLIRDVAMEGSSANREALRDMSRQRASERLRRNQANQDESVNETRRPARVFEVGSLAFVIKSSQSTGKLDSGMRGPYRVLKALPHGRYELQLVAGAYGKLTQAAAEFMVPWRGEWTPDACAAFFEGEFVCCVKQTWLILLTVHPLYVFKTG